MPHALFLGSKLATIERTTGKEEEEEENTDIDGKPVSSMEPSPSSSTPLPSSPSARSLGYIRTHLHHAQVDIAVSLLAFALVVNSAILIVASAAFYNKEADGVDTSDVQQGNLFSAYALIKSRTGEAFAYLFALALMMSGQAASITVTLAGQVVSEGFIEWRTTPWKRRLATRAIGMVPSLAVSAAVGQRGVNTLLVASQVTLSIVLPFVMFPCVHNLLHCSFLKKGDSLG